MRDGKLTEEQEQMWERLNKLATRQVEYIDVDSMLAAQVKAYLKQIENQTKIILKVNNVGRH